MLKGERKDLTMETETVDWSSISSIPSEARVLFQTAEDALPEKMKVLSKSAMQLLRLSDLNIQEKSMVAPLLKQGFVNCMFAERRILTRMKDAKKKLEEEALSVNDGKPRYQAHLEVSKGEKMQRVNEAIEAQTEVVRYVEELCKIFGGFGYDVKNSLELMKLSS